MPTMRPGETGALCAETDAERHWALSTGERLLAGATISHNYLAFYPDAMEACRIAGELDEALRYANALERYTADEPFGWSDFFIERTRALIDVTRGNRGAELAKRLKALQVAGETFGFHFHQPAIEQAIDALET